MPIVNPQLISPRLQVALPEGRGFLYTATIRFDVDANTDALDLGPLVGTVTGYTTPSPPRSMITSFCDGGGARLNIPGTNVGVLPVLVGGGPLGVSSIVMAFRRTDTGVVGAQMTAVTDLVMTFTAVS